MLTLQNFTKSYNDTRILTIPLLCFETGIYWIKGANGCGKTTLFKSLAGILPYEGDIFFDDHVDAALNPVEFRKRVNYSQAEPLYPGFLTAKDLINFIGKTKSASSIQRKELTQIFGIDTFLEKNCASCSSGMLKKISLTLAFLGAPTVIILDEPLVTLDDAARKVLFSLIHEYNIKHQTTFIFSSHQPIESVDLAITKTFCIKNKMILST